MDAIPLQLFGLLKLIRVRRLSRIILQLNLREDTKMVNMFITNSVVPKVGKARLLPHNVLALLGVHLVPDCGTRQDMDPTTGLCLHRNRSVRSIRRISILDVAVPFGINAHRK